MIDRRALIGTALATTVAAALPAVARARSFGTGRPIGINLYMLAAAYRREGRSLAMRMTLRIVRDGGRRPPL